MLSISPRSAPESPRPEREPTNQAARAASNDRPRPGMPASPGDAQSTPADAGENRSAQRFPASAVPSITGLRLSPRGVAAVLVNISTSGLLAECSERLQTGSKVIVLFDGTFVPQSAEGRVARNSVSSMSPNGRLQYHVGISFTQPITLEVGSTTEHTTEPTEVKPAEPPADPIPTTPIVRNRW